MTAYVMVDIEVTDPAGYEEYKRLAAPTVAAYGASTSCAAARWRRWRAIGRPIASSCWNSKAPPAPGSG